MKSNKILLFLIILLCGIFLVPLSSYAATSISDSNKISITMDKSTAIYTGDVIKPTITVKHKKTLFTSTLTEDKDYTVTYYEDYAGTQKCSTNSPKNPKNYYIKIKGKGNYTGSTMLQFAILKCPMKNVSVSLDYYTWDYTGDVIKPTVTVKHNGNILEKNTDYSITYKDIVNVGTATVSVTGKGNYTDTKDVNFYIKYFFTKNKGELILDTTEYTYTGDEIIPKVTVKYNGKILSSKNDYTVTGSNNKNVGNYAQVTVSGKNNYAGALSKEFKIKPLSLKSTTISLDKKDNIYDYTGKKVEPKITVKSPAGITLQKNNDYTVTYENNINVGTAKAIIKPNSNNCYGSIEKKFEIKYDISKQAKVSLSSTSFEYTGEAIKPKVDVKKGTTLLKEGTDYWLSYSKNTNVGKATVSINGKGDYTGKIDKNFTITACSLNSDKTMVQLTESKYEYTGSQIKPKIIATFDGKTLVEKKDYTISYGKNINAGEASGTIKISGIKNGNYKDSKTFTFNIEKCSLAKTTITFNDKKDGIFEYTGKEIKPKITVKTSTGKQVNSKEYSVEYSENIKVGTHTITIKGKDNGNFTGSKSVKFSIKYNLGNTKAVKVSLKETKYTYTGSPICPTSKDKNLTVMNGNQEMILEKDYTLEYLNNKIPGIATIVIKGIGDYTGSKNQSFTIERCQMKDTDIKITDSDFVYTGNKIEPNIVVTYKNNTLKKNTDYAVSYEKNINAGTGKIIITGKKYFTGKEEKEFKINVLPIDVAEISLDKNKTIFDFTGREIKPQVVVKYAGKTLKLNRDYKVVEYLNNKNVGMASVTVKGDGKNCINETTTVFWIKYPINSSTTKITLNNENFIYTGETIKPEIRSVTYNKNTALVEGKDYEVSYSVANGRKYNECKLEDIKNVGTYKVTLTGKDNYNGTIEKTFKINTCSLNSTATNLSVIGNIEYTGNNITPDIKVRYNDRLLTKGVDYKVYSITNNKNAGTASIRIQGQGNYKDFKTFTFEINQRSIDNKEIKVTLDKTVLVYNGKVQKVPTLTIQDNAKKLKLNTDYTISYMYNNKTCLAKDIVNIGTYQIKIAGRGNYKGETLAEFSIRGSLTNVDKENIKIGTLLPNNIFKETNSFVYTGNEIKPDVVIKYKDYQLVEGIDFEVDYENNINANVSEQTHSRAIISGIGNFYGTIAKPFTIERCSIDVGNKDVKVVEIKPSGKVVVRNNDVTLIEDVDYQIKLEPDDSSIMTETIEIRGINNYIGSRKFKHDTIEYEKEMLYTGKELKPEVTLYSQGKKLTENKDYKVQYENNINATERARIIISSMDNSKKETKIRYFKISKLSIKDKNAKIKFIGGPIYIIDDGEAAKPELNITYNINGNELVLKQDIDYKVEYSNNKEPGEGIAKITGINNFTDTVEMTFDVGKLISENIMNIPYINQKDIDFTIGSTSISEHGGSIVSYNMVLNYLQQRSVSIKYLANKYYKAGYFRETTDSTMFVNDASSWGVTVQQKSSYEAWKDNLVIKALENNHPIIVKDGNEYMVLTGVRKYITKAGEGYIVTVNNPNGSKGEEYPTTYFSNLNSLTYFIFNTREETASMQCIHSPLEITIWEFLIANGYGEVQTAGVLGNINVESDFIVNNMENAYEEGGTKANKPLDENGNFYNDQTYTDAVNSGKYTRTRFINDAVGYGLLQWTYVDRKAGLYDLAKNSGRDIDDLNLQMEWILKELNNLNRSGEFMRTTSAYRAGIALGTSINENQSDLTPRGENAQMFYNLYKTK